MRARRYTGTVRLLLIASAILPGLASGGNRSDASDSNDKKLDYRELVKGLASPNKPCKCEIDGNDVQFPPGYGGAAQVRIEKNRQTLYEHCEDALPALIEGCTDSRYSMTWRSDSYCGNMCVGEVCLEIIAHRLEAYRSYMSLHTKEDYYGYRFVPRLNGAIGDQVSDTRKKEIEDWWRGRKGKNLVELQIQAFDWAINRRTEQDKRFRAANGGKSLVASNEISRTTAARDKIRKEGKCLPPESPLMRMVNP